MDKQTIESYNNEAKAIASLHSTLIPTRIYELIKNYFIPFAETADIGCGIGRDTHWLNKQGFSTIGIDASEKLLAQARILYPYENFIQDFLPNLNQLGTTQFHNILCSAVMMHLNKNDLKTACIRLIRLLNNNGHLIVSVRGTNEVNHRENGKLYESINIDDLLSFFKRNGCEVLIMETETESTRNLTWHNFVIRNSKHNSNFYI